MEVGTYSIATLVGGAKPPSHGSDRPQSTPCSVARQQAASPGFSTQSNKRCDPVRLRKRFCNCVATAARYPSVPSWAVLVIYPGRHRQYADIQNLALIGYVA